MVSVITILLPSHPSTFSVSKWFLFDPHLHLSLYLFLASYMRGSKEQMGGKRNQGNMFAVTTLLPLSIN